MMCLYFYQFLKSRGEEPTSAAEKKESPEEIVVSSSSCSLWKLSTWGKVRVPSLSAKGITQTLTQQMKCVALLYKPETEY